MLAWTLTADQAVLFFEICEELGATTEKDRTAVLVQMAKLGHVKNLTKTDLSKVDYLRHLSKHFRVGEIKDNGSISIYRDDLKEPENGRERPH